MPFRQIGVFARIGLGLVPKPALPRINRAVTRCESRRTGRVIQVGIEVSQAVVGLIGVRHAIPTHSLVQSQPVVDSPVVLKISRPGYIVILAAVMHGFLGVPTGVAQQEVASRPGLPTVQSPKENLSSARGW